MSAPAGTGAALRPPALRGWLVLLGVCLVADALIFWRVFDGRLPRDYEYEISAENEARLHRLMGDVLDTWPDTRRFMALVFAVKFDIGRSAMPTLIEYTKHEVPAMRQVALGCLGAIEDHNATPAVLEAMADPAPFVVFQACMTLGDLGDPRARDPLAQALDHPDFRVRAAAALNLGIVGCRAQDVEALIAHIEDPEGQVGQTIQRALSEVCHVNPMFLGRSRILWEQWWETTGRAATNLPEA